MQILYILHCALLTIVLHLGLLILVIVATILGPVCYCYFRIIHHYSPRKTIQHIIWWHGRTWGWLVQSLVPVTVINKCSNPPLPCIVVMNHQSFYDPYCLCFTPIRSLAFIVQAWPFRIPLYGLFMRKAEYLDSSQMPAPALLAKAAQLLNEDTSIVVFPEGTRSPTGQVGRFHSGIFHLAISTGKQIIPLCIQGTGSLLKKKSFIIRPTRLTLTLLPAIDPSLFFHYGDRAYYMLRAHIKQLIEQELQKTLVKEPT